MNRPPLETICSACEINMKRFNQIVCDQCHALSQSNNTNRI